MDKITYLEPEEAIEHNELWRQMMDAELRKTIGKQLTNLPDMPELAHAVIQPKEYPL